MLVRSCVIWALCLSGCERDAADDIELARTTRPASASLRVGERYPVGSEALAVGRFEAAVARDSHAFRKLVRCDGPNLVFKNEEKTDADRMMTERLCERTRRLAGLVAREWPEVALRVTDAWDERREHAPTSVHYEGRAADITTSDLDAGKLGRLSGLAIEAGFDWVFYEDRTHVHVSVKR